MLYFKEYRQQLTDLLKVARKKATRTPHPSPLHPLKPHIVILTGAGISEASGLPTFRSQGGLWENRRLEEIATIEALEANPADVLRFYNERRRALRAVVPNAAHYALAELETHFQVSIITQNVDDLHERAGSTKVLHLHGELRYATSMTDPAYRHYLGDDDIHPGDTCPAGGQLRPHVVLFGENVPHFPAATGICERADFFIIIGTSLQVYPAAALIDYPPPDCPCFFIDPAAGEIDTSNITTRDLLPIAEPAITGVPRVVKALIANRMNG